MRLSSVALSRGDGRICDFFDRILLNKHRLWCRCHLAGSSAKEEHAQHDAACLLLISASIESEPESGLWLRKEHESRIS